MSEEKGAREEQGASECTKWICAKARGSQVLHLGVESEAAVALAIKGAHVVDVDCFDGRDRELRQKQLALLPEDVATRVVAVSSDEMEPLDSDEERVFDVLVLPDTLARYARPAEFLEYWLGFIKDEGRVTITVPFGYVADARYRCVFTVSDFVEVVLPYVAFDFLEITDGKLRFIGRKDFTLDKERPLSTEQMLHLTETGLIESQYLLSDQLAILSKRIGDHQTAGGGEVLDAAPVISHHGAESGELGPARIANLRKLQIELARKRQEVLALKREIGDRAADIEGLQLQIEELEPFPHTIAYQFGEASVSAVSSVGGFVKYPYRIARIAGEAIRRKALRKQESLLPEMDPVQLMERELHQLYESSGKEAFEDGVQQELGGGKVPVEYIHRIAFDILRVTHFLDALPHAVAALKLNPTNEKLLGVLADQANRRIRHGEYEEAVAAASAVRDGLGMSAVLPNAGAYHRAARVGMIFPIMALQDDGKVAFARVAGPDHETLTDIFKTEGKEGVEELIREHLSLKNFKPLELERFAFQALQSLDPEAALAYGEKIYKKFNDDLFGKMLSDFHRHCGNLTRGFEILQRVDHDPLMRGRAYRMVEGQLELFQKGYPSGDFDPALAYSPEKLRALYLLHNSLPFTSGGYATRAHGLLTSMVRTGYDVDGLTRFGFPLDLKKGGASAAPSRDEVDGVTYHRMLTFGRGYGATPLPDYLNDYSEALLEFCCGHKPSLLHAASNFMNGVVCNRVAARLGIPSIYEVRGLWEITRISRQPDWKDSDFYNLQVRMELEAAQNASAVVAITSALKDEMVRRGVPDQKIRVIHNGADPERFVPMERDIALEDELGVKGKTVIGYIGSVVDYEGLEYLLQAAALMKTRRSDFKIIIVGDGAVWEDLKALSSELGTEDVVTFTGRVPHEEVERYYSLMDITPYPRRGLPVCEMVSPMKPFEAMCMEKAVIASDVAALGEIVRDGETGLLHRKDDVEDLTAKLELLVADRELRKKFGSAAREWVVRERDWRVLAGKFTDLYEELYEQFQRDSSQFRIAV